MESADSICHAADLGALGVFHLKRMWSRVLLSSRGTSAGEAARDDWGHDNVVLAGLGLAIEETWQYLSRTAPSYEEFERWVLEKNGGSIEAWRIARINAAIGGTDPPEDARRMILEVEQDAPVLDADALASWDEDGYVVVPDAIPEEGRRATECAIWEHLGMNADDPETWYRRPIGHGIMVQFFHHPALRANRASRRIHKAFAHLWGTADLWVTTDRVSMNPPERPGWTFPGPRLHWDASIEPPIPFGVQGLVYLTDTPAEQGAFTCVPGFHRRIEEWLGGLPEGADPRAQDLERLGAVPIAGRAGDLIIWHHALPHGSRPNRALRPRLVHYITMFPLERQPNSTWR